MYETNVSQICKQIRRDFLRKPVKWHYLGNRNGHKVFILEAALKNPYFDYSKDFSDIERPFKKRKPVRRSNQPWDPESLWGELLLWLWDIFIDACFGNLRD